jgi:hypothetical protein
MPRFFPLRCSLTIFLSGLAWNHSPSDLSLLHSLNDRFATLCSAIGWDGVSKLLPRLALKHLRSSQSQLLLIQSPKCWDYWYVSPHPAKCRYYYIISREPIINMISLLMLTEITWPRWYVMFSTVNTVMFFSPSFWLYSLKISHYVQPSVKE